MTDFVSSPQILTVIFMARRFRSRPSDILQIADGYEAYCFDEACCWIISQLDEGKRPFFGKTAAKQRQNEGIDSPSVNMQTIEMMKKLGAEVKGL